MNKQSLYMVGGALLASTALSTGGAQAATLKTNPGAGNVAQTFTAKGLATQIFGTSGQADVTLGTSTSTVLIDFASALSVNFNVQIDITGGSFVQTTASATPYWQSSSVSSAGTLAATSSAGCSVQVLTDKILIENCTPGNGAGTASVSRIDAIGITGIQVTSASGLATASTSVSLSGIVRNQANTVTFENLAATAYITSKSALDSAVVANTSTLTADNTASPAFAKLTNSVTTATLGTIRFSATGAVGTDLSVVLSSTVLASTAEIKITHGVLSDDALSQIELTTTGTGVATRTSGQFVSGTVSFTVPSAASLVGASIGVVFNGTSAIDASTGSATVTPTVGSTLTTAISSFSGSLASISRGGLSTQLNTVLSTGTAGYSSFVRIMNSGADAGVATLTVRNDMTGATLGFYTTDSIVSNGTVTVSSANIESRLGLTASASVNYKVNVSGPFNGYAQHLVFNSVSGVFSDFSGFRNGTTTSP